MFYQIFWIVMKHIFKKINEKVVDRELGVRNECC